jgi:hypothetical protein
MKSWKVAAAAALLVAVAAGAFLLWPGDDGSGPGGGDEEARAVAEALRTLTSDPDSLVAEPSRELVGRRARRAVPPSAEVDPDEDSWQPDGHGGGVMTVTVSARGRPSVDYAAVVVKEPDGWKVLGTVALTGQSR